MIECLDGQLSVKSLSVGCNKLVLFSDRAGKLVLCSVSIYAQFNLPWDSFLNSSFFEVSSCVRRREVFLKTLVKTEKVAILYLFIYFREELRAAALHSLFAVILFLSLVMAHWSDFT